MFIDKDSQPVDPFDPSWAAYDPAYLEKAARRDRSVFPF